MHQHVSAWYCFSFRLESIQQLPRGCFYHCLQRCYGRGLTQISSFYMTGLRVRGLLALAFRDLCTTVSQQAQISAYELAGTNNKADQKIGFVVCTVYATWLCAYLCSGRRFYFSDRIYDRAINQLNISHWCIVALAETIFQNTHIATRTRLVAWA